MISILLYANQTSVVTRKVNWVVDLNIKCFFDYGRGGGETPDFAAVPEGWLRLMRLPVEKVTSPYHSHRDSEA